MKEFVILDFGKGITEVEARVVDAKELLELLDVARRDEDVKICVYELGECLLDWS